MGNLDSLIQEFHFYDKCRGLTDKTILKHMKHMSIFQRFLQEHQVSNMEQISTQHIRYFVSSLLDSGKAESYVNSHIKSIRAFFVFCENEEYIQTIQNPCLRVNWIREPQKVIETFTDEEVARMIYFADESRGNKCPTLFSKFQSQRNKLIIMILADVAIRCNELCNLKMEDFSVERIFIRKGKGKKERVVFTSKVVARQYFKYARVRQEYMEARDFKDSEYLFMSKYGKKITVDAVERLITKAGNKSGVRECIRCCPHDFRHYSAQKMLNNSGNVYAVSKVLGHSRTQTTEVYLGSLVNTGFIEEMRENSPLDNL